jgi:hypothetical protein
MTRTVVVYGSKGCGKTANAEFLRKKFGCFGVLDEVHNGFYVQGYLHLTSMPEKKLLLAKDVEFISFSEAMK